jgi:hypothetical protein
MLCKVPNLARHLPVVFFRQAMNPNKVIRNKINVLTDLPNIGKAMEKDLLAIGIEQPSQLTGKSPYEMYKALCLKTGIKHDPCVLDVFLSITRFMEGDEPKPWWKYTEERKKHIQETETIRQLKRDISD